MKKSKLIFRVTLVFIMLTSILPLYCESKEKINDDSSIAFTNMEKEFIKNIKQKGKLVLAYRKGDAPNVNLTNETKDSFMYNYAAEFAKFLDVDIEVKYVMFGELFSKKGKDIERVKKEADYSYTPDIFDDVDMLVSNLTINKWRKKLMDFVEIFPNREILVAKSGKDFSNFAKLNGKSFVTLKFSSFEDNMRRIEAENNIKVQYIDVPILDDMWKTVSEDRADFTIDDAMNAIIRMKVHQNLKIVIPVSDLEKIGWGIRKDNTELKSLFEKFNEQSIKNGTFNRLWLKYNGISFQEYKRMINY